MAIVLFNQGFGQNYSWKGQLSITYLWETSVWPSPSCSAMIFVINQVHTKETNVPGRWLDWRLKSASPFNESARASSGMGAAKTTTCVRNETVSMRDLMINIRRGLSEWGVGWRPAWQSYCSQARSRFIPEAGAIYIPSCFTYCLATHLTTYQL